MSPTAAGVLREDDAHRYGEPAATIGGDRSSVRLSGRTSGYRRVVLRWLCALLVGAVLSGFTFLLVTGRYSTDGPIVVSLSAAHGLHLGDLFVVAGWAVAMLAVVRLTVTAR